MNGPQSLHDKGQSLWLDNITRDLLDNGTLKRYIDEWSITGLTSNPTIFDHAIKNSTAYDAAIAEKLRNGKSGEALFFELALEDLTRAADLFRPIHEKTNGVDGYVSWKFPRCSPMTRPAPSPPQKICPHARIAPTCSSRFPARRKGFPR